MKIGIITAMPEEFRAVAKSLGAFAMVPTGAPGVRRFSTAGNEFALVESGMGFDNAARAAEALLRDFQPDLLVSAGYCGGIEQELLVGDVVVAQKVVIANESGYEEVPVLLHSISQTFIARQAVEGNRVVGGAFVSTTVLTSKSRLAAMLAGFCHNPVVEMESGAIAIIAAENHIPLLAIRAVSDSAAEELGFSLDEFCDQDMRRIRPHKVLLTILKRPRIIPQLVRLSGGSRKAAECLTLALSRLFLLFENSSRL
jgi:adenosylhomocysteine nucleosidase